MSKPEPTPIIRGEAAKNLSERLKHREKYPMCAAKKELYRGARKAYLKGKNGKLRCKYEYHDDAHPTLCEFEDTLMHYLVPDATLTPGARKLRDNLIKGVERMAEKVRDFKRMHVKMGTISLSCISSKDAGITLILKRPIRVKRSIDEGYWILECPSLGLLSYDMDYEVALELFQDYFVSTYDYFALGDSKKMVGKALEIRKSLREIVKEVGK